MEHEIRFEEGAARVPMKEISWIHGQQISGGLLARIGWSPLRAGWNADSSRMVATTGTQNTAGNPDFVDTPKWPN